MAAPTTTRDFTLNRNGIIKAALRILGVLKAGSDPSKDEFDAASEALNVMVKSWQADGMGLWLNRDAILSLTPGTASYLLATDGLILVRPLEILEARYVGADLTQVPVEIVTRSEYVRIPVKTDQGPVAKVYYDPQLFAGVLYVWPTGVLATDDLILTVKYPILDLDASTDNAEFPVEWLRAIKYGLASELAPEYSDKVTPQQVNLIDARAVEYKRVASGADTEGSIFMYPNRGE